MKISGIVAMCGFPFWQMTLASLAEKVDGVYIRFDGVAGDRSVFKKIKRNFRKYKIKELIIKDEKWNKFNWREDLIRMLDVVKPDLVINLDEDEIVEDKVMAEINPFIKSEKDSMMLSYRSPMPTIDDRIVLDGNVYPGDPHMKIFKWRPDLSYLPYTGWARIKQYTYSKKPDLKDYWIASAKILHYCMYTRDLEKNKKMI